MRDFEGSSGTLADPSNFNFWNRGYCGLFWGSLGPKQYYQLELGMDHFLATNFDDFERPRIWRSLIEKGDLRSGTFAHFGGSLSEPDILSRCPKNGRRVNARLFEILSSGQGIDPSTRKLPASGRRVRWPRPSIKRAVCVVDALAETQSPAYSPACA